MTTQTTAPLEIDEINELRDYLAQQKEKQDGLSIVQAHGYIAGLICGPEVIHPAVWISDIFNGPAEFEDDEHEDRILKYLCRMYTHTAHCIIKNEDFSEHYYPAHPIHMETDVDFQAVQDWCGAFTMGVADDNWIEISDFQMITFPIIISSAEDEDETMKEFCEERKSDAEEVRRYFLKYITPSVYQLYGYLAQIKHYVDITMLQDSPEDGEEAPHCHDKNCDIVH